MLKAKKRILTGAPGKFRLKGFRNEQKWFLLLNNKGGGYEKNFNFYADLVKAHIKIDSPEKSQQVDELLKDLGRKINFLFLPRTFKTMRGQSRGIPVPDVFPLEASGSC